MFSWRSIFRAATIPPYSVVVPAGWQKVGTKDPTESNGCPVNIGQLWQIQKAEKTRSFLSWNSNTWNIVNVTGWWLRHPSQKYESIGMIIPNIWKYRKCSKPPTRSVFVFGKTWKLSKYLELNVDRAATRWVETNFYRYSFVSWYLMPSNLHGYRTPN